MNATKPNARKSDPTASYALAHSLSRLERDAVLADAAPYRAVLLRMLSKLDEVEPGSVSGASLNGHLAAGELHENVYYQHAGPCRPVLDASFAAKFQAKEILDHAMRWSMDRFNPSHKEDLTHGKS